MYIYIYISIYIYTFIYFRVYPDSVSHIFICNIDRTISRDLYLYLSILLSTYRYMCIIICCVLYRLSSSTSKGILSNGQGRLHMQTNPPARSKEIDALSRERKRKETRQHWFMSTLDCRSRKLKRNDEKRSVDRHFLAHLLIFH